MTNNELLLEISIMLDKKLQAELYSIKKQLQNIENKLPNAENEIKDVKFPYSYNIAKIESAIMDIKLFNAVVNEHSEKLQKLA